MRWKNSLREELEKRGYSFCHLHIAKRDLWFTSGHEDNYADSMYAPTKIEDEEYRLKPMNCPFHIGIYKSSPQAIAIFHNDIPKWAPFIVPNFRELCMG